jgi:type I restriction enzyme M protein
MARKKTTKTESTSSDIATIPTGPLNASTVNSIVWRACDTFRGVVQPANYKDYILTMLFIKFLTDTRDERLEEYRRQYAGDEARVQRAMSKERFQLPKACDFHFLRENAKSARLGELIDEVLAGITKANGAKLENVFSQITFNSDKLGDTKERNTRLQHLVDDFDRPELDLRPSRVQGRDVIGDAYEFLIARFAADAGQSGGEFYTPKEVAQLLAQVLAPQAGNTIYDPCCGSGSLLLRTGRAVGDADFALFGQEMNAHTWALCRMNMFLRNADSATIERGDTIRSPRLIKDGKLMKFDVVIANPPFGVDKWGHEVAESDIFKRFEDGVPPKSRGEYAFIQHVVASMNENGGRAGIVVPLGVLFRGASEGSIRRAFIERNLVETVIALPSNLFYGVGIPAALLFLRKGRKDSNVFFVDASREFEEGKNQNKLSEAHLAKILATVKARKSVEKYAHLATIEEIKANDYNLNVPLYVDTFEEEAPVDLVAVKADIARIDGELTKVRAELSAALKELGL